MSKINFTPPTNFLRLVNMNDETSNSKNDTYTTTEDIIRYLLAQEQTLFEDYDLQQQDLTLPQIQSILDELLNNIYNRGKLIEEYQAQLRANNQFPLFKINDIIPDFCIDDELYKKITFRETLVISSMKKSASMPTPSDVIGGFCLEVQAATGKNPLLRKDPGLEQKLVELFTCKTTPKTRSVIGLNIIDSEEELDNFEKLIKPFYKHINSKFLIHSSSHFNVHGKVAGSRITAWVDRYLYTLEEKRTEFINEHEKSLYCALQPHSYFIKHSSKPDCFLDKKYYSFGKTRELICEGANIILMRYLVITKYMGKFELSTMYINGDMCRNIYECCGPESCIINNQKVDVCKIHRTIIEECGIIHQCETLLLHNGQIVRQKWVDCDYVLHINPFAELSNKSPPPNEHLMLEKVWEKDMELFSSYLDCKSESNMQLKSYLKDHQEFKDMMADYVQATLLMKPEDVLDFTIKHFQQYYPIEHYNNKIKNT